MGTVRIGGIVKSSPSTQFWLESDVVEQNSAGNWSRVYFWLRAANGPSGTGSSQYSGAGNQIGYANESEFGRHSGNPFLPAGYAQNQQRWHDGPWERIFYHDGNGNHGNISLRMYLGYGSINESHYGSIQPPRIGQVPGQVSGVTASNVQPNQATISWNTPSRGNADINNYDLHVCTSTAFNGVGCPHYNWINSTATSKVVTGLTPGTVYYVRVRAQNSDGQGAWSATYSFQTIVSTPPGISVVASPAGTAATVTLTPPTGVTNVDSYTVTATYLSPAPIPNPPSQTFTTSTNTLNAQGLIPGATYAWSATATVGSYTSPASAPVNVAQPKPNTAPGDYFDGNTTDTPDINYAWTGTTNLSTSTATGVGVDGWEVADVPVGGAAALYRTTGGFAGSFSALAQITRGTGLAGYRFGQANVAGKRTATEVAAMYVGSVHVMPSRQQRLVAEITWVTAAGALVSRSVGDPAVVPASIWTRLIVADVAPATSAYGLIRVLDVTGDGWTAWAGGETLRMDAAMISLGSVFPYFDGDTVDTASFTYDWEGTANASISVRDAITTIYDPLNDPDCVDVPPSPRPPVVPSDCIVDVGLWRRYWAYIPAYTVSDWLTTIPTLVLTTYGAPERQVRIRYYADPFTRPADQINTEDFCSEQIISYIPPNTEMTLDGVTERAWASVQGGGSLGADHLLYGSNGTPAEWPHLSCGIGYWVSLDVPNEAPAGNLTPRVLVTQRV